MQHKMEKVKFLQEILFKEENSPSHHEPSACTEGWSQRIQLRHENHLRHSHKYQTEDTSSNKR